MEERTINTLEEMEKYLEETFQDMQNFIDEYFEEEEEDSVEFLHWKEEFLRDEEIRKEKVKVGGGFFEILATYGHEEFEWVEYYSSQKDAEEDVIKRVYRMREYDHTPLQADKLEWVVEPY